MPADDKIISLIQLSISNNQLNGSGEMDANV